jgi:hypothetical protein
VKWATAACSLALAGLAGCSLGGGEQPPRVTGAAREVASVVERLERAVAGRDWGAICDDLFTSAARRRAGGADCPRLLRSDAAGVRSPRIEVVRIAIKGDRAAARVRTRARGQPPLTDVIELRREDGRYRVESLGG